MAVKSLHDSPVVIPDGLDGSVSGLLTVPPHAIGCYVFAHGAGAGMRHEFMQSVSDGLAMRKVATLRYQFPYMERQSRRPDSPSVAHRTVRAAVSTAREKTRLPLFAGGKSFGGRMTSQVQESAPLQEVLGLVFLGFPLHPPDKPSSERATHLSDIHIPMLFVQGTRDKLAETERIKAVVAGLGPPATLQLIEHADHGFDVLVRSGRKPADVFNELLDGMVAWMTTHVKRTA